METRTNEKPSFLESLRQKIFGSRPNVSDTSFQPLVTPELIANLREVKNHSRNITHDELANIESWLFELERALGRLEKGEEISPAKIRDLEYIRSAAMAVIEKVNN